MKSRALVLALAAAFAAVAALPASAQFTPPQPSPGAKVSQAVGASEVAVSYSRPAVKGRVIWGELVPWDKPWRAGANENTVFSVSRDVKIEGQPLPAGSYGWKKIEMVFDVPSICPSIKLFIQL